MPTGTLTTIRYRRDNSGTSMRVPGFRGGGIPLIRRKPCTVCGTYMTMRRGETGKAWEKRKRCSRECYYESIRGRKLSEEHKRKISVTNTGDPRVSNPGPKGPASPTWKGDAADYPAAHVRVRVERGNARDYRCPCGKRARHWAFRWDRAETVIEHPNGPYSFDVADYEPMCPSCHRRFDNTRQ